MSKRQRKWMDKMTSEGRCKICGKTPLQTKLLCDYHAKKASEYALKKYYKNKSSETTK